MSYKNWTRMFSSLTFHPCRLHSNPRTYHLGTSNMHDLPEDWTSLLKLAYSAARLTGQWQQILVSLWNLLPLPWHRVAMTQVCEKEEGRGPAGMLQCSELCREQCQLLPSLRMNRIQSSSASGEETLLDVMWQRGAGRNRERHIWDWWMCQTLPSLGFPFLLLGIGRLTIGDKWFTDQAD